MNRIEFPQACQDVRQLSRQSSPEQQARCLDRLYRVIATGVPAEQTVALKLFNDTLGKLDPQAILEANDEESLVGLVAPLCAHGASAQDALYLAAQRGFLSLIKQFEQAEVVDLALERSDDCATAFHLACQAGHSALATYLSSKA